MARSIDKHFRVNREEADMLQVKSSKAGLHESELMRLLIMGYEPREQPDERFYEALNDLRRIGINLNQIAKALNIRGYFDSENYEQLAKELIEFMLLMKREYLTPERKK